MNSDTREPHRTLGAENLRVQDGFWELPMHFLMDLRNQKIVVSCEFGAIHIRWDYTCNIPISLDESFTVAIPWPPNYAKKINHHPLKRVTLYAEK